MPHSYRRFGRTGVVAVSRPSASAWVLSMPHGSAHRDVQERHRFGCRTAAGRQPLQTRQCMHLSPHEARENFQQSANAAPGTYCTPYPPGTGIPQAFLPERCVYRIFFAESYCLPGPQSFGCPAYQDEARVPWVAWPDQVSGSRPHWLIAAPRRAADSHSLMPWQVCRSIGSSQTNGHICLGRLLALQVHFSGTAE